MNLAIVFSDVDEKIFSLSPKKKIRSRKECRDYCDKFIRNIVGRVDSTSGDFPCNTRTLYAFDISSREDNPHIAISHLKKGNVCSFLGGEKLETSAPKCGVHVQQYDPEKSIPNPRMGHVHTLRIKNHGRNGRENIFRASGRKNEISAPPSFNVGPVFYAKKKNSVTYEARSYACPL